MMQLNRTLSYLENTQLKIRELVNNRLEGSYDELLKQVDEMNSFLAENYGNNLELITELNQQPELIKPSIFNQNQSELLTVGYLGALAPYILIILFALFLPVTLIFLIIRWQNKNRTLENLRILDSHINRLAMTLKMTSW